VLPLSEIMSLKGYKLWLVLSLLFGDYFATATQAAFKSFQRNAILYKGGRHWQRLESNLWVFNLIYL
jgi:hypothetical protein